MIKSDEIKKIYDIAKEHILKFIPIPHSLGVEVSDSAIKLVLLKHPLHEPASLIDYAIIPTIEKKTSDEAAISLAVKSILKDKKLYNATLAKIAVSGAGVDTKRLTLPSMPKDEISQALRWEGKEYFLFDVESSALDFDLLEERIKEDGTKSIEIIATLIENRFIDTKLSIVKNTNIPPVVITSVAYALSNFYRLNKDMADDDPVALIDIGAHTTTVLILKENKVRFIRQLGCAGDDFTKAMMGTLTSDRGKIDLSLKDAEELKKEVGIPGESSSQIKDGISTQQISYLLRPAIERLARDIKMSLDYYASHFNEGVVSRVILSGGTSKLKNISTEFSNRLSVPTESISLPKGLKLKLGPERLAGLGEDLPLLIPAIGVALSSIDKINLIPPAYKKHKIKKVEEFFIRLIFIIVCLISVTSYMLNGAREKTLHKQLSARMPQQEKLKEFQNLHIKITQKNLIMNQTLTSQGQFYYVFKALSNIIPKTIYFESLVISNRGSDMSIEGIALETADAAEIVLTRFLKALEDSHLFNNVSLASSSDIDSLGKEAVEFKINCKI